MFLSVCSSNHIAIMNTYPCFVCVCDLPQEKQRMTDKLEDTSLRLKDEMDLYRKMMDKLRQNRLQFHKEKEEMQEVGGAISSDHAHGHRVGCLLSLFSLFYSPLSHCWYSIVLFISLLSVVADRGPSSRTGAPATLQAGVREARPWSQLFLWAG